MSITVYALTAAHFQINASYLINVPSTLLKLYYYIDTDEIPGFFLLLKNHIFIARSEDTIFIFHV